MRKLMALVMVLILAMTAVGCGREADDEDRDRDNRASRREDSGKTRDNLLSFLDDPELEDDPEAFWEDSGNYGKSGEGDRSGKGSGGNEFYDFYYLDGPNLMFMFKELKFSNKELRSWNGSYHIISASFRYVGEDVVDGRKSRHFACEYYEEYTGYPDMTKDTELEVWINEDLEPVQVLEGSELISDYRDSSALLLFSAMYELGNSSFVVYNEDELNEWIKDWDIDKKSRKTADFGFGDVQVTCYELSRQTQSVVDPMEYLDYEYAKIGSKLLRTREAYYTDGSREPYEELIVERVIPY